MWLVNERNKIPKNNDIVCLKNIELLLVCLKVEVETFAD